MTIPERACLLASAALLVAATAYYLSAKRIEKRVARERRKRAHRMDRHNTNTTMRRYMEPSQTHDHEELRRTLRMPTSVYNRLLDLLRPLITFQHTSSKRCVTAEERLAITLQYLALGDGFLSLQQQFRVGLSTLKAIVAHTCQAIRDCLEPIYLVTPSTVEEWREIASGFNTHWHFPNCLGAVDGKHIRIVCPQSSGNYYRNYKEYFSVVLLGIVNHNYEFIYVSTGTEGKVSGGDIWKNSTFFEYFNDPTNPLNIPPPTPLPEVDGDMPMVLLGDKAFVLAGNFMRPYGGPRPCRRERIFNYRLSCGRQNVENVFGIMTMKFKIFQRTIEMQPATVDKIVMATVCLHNFMRKHCGSRYIGDSDIDHETPDHDVIAGEWRNSNHLDSVEPSRTRNPPVYAKQIRDKFSQYFITKEGEVEWQYRLALHEYD